MANWLSALKRTRNTLAGAFSKMTGRGGPSIDLEELEETLLKADIPVRLADELVQRAEEADANSDIKGELRSHLLAACGDAADPSWESSPGPCTVMVVGVNGAGKTTTCAKLAYRLKKMGHCPMLGATDTFRAAGADQLKIWADKVGVNVVAGAQGADAAAVAFDTLDSAIARNCDVVLLDTAGRMHTKQPLMDELDKIRRALAKRVEDAPHEVWLTLDASMGQNAIVQARVFHEAVQLTGAIVTKLDGSSKGGFLLSVTRELNIPIYFVGLGESEDDLVPFDPPSYIDALLEMEAELEESGV